MSNLWEWFKVEQVSENWNQASLESKINSLENQIVSKYKIPYSRLMELATFSAEKWAEALRSELKKDFENRWWMMVNYEEITKSINEIVELRSELIRTTKEKIKFVQKDYTDWIDASEHLSDPKDFLISKYLSPKTIERCKNPQNFTDHAVWLGVWLAESCAVAWKFAWEIVIWIIRFPIDLYLILTWKAEYNWWKKM